MIQQFHVKAEIVATCPDCWAKTLIDSSLNEFVTHGYTISTNCIGCDAELVITGFAKET